MFTNNSHSANAPFLIPRGRLVVHIVHAPRPCANNRRTLLTSGSLAVIDCIPSSLTATAGFISACKLAAAVVSVENESHSSLFSLVDNAGAEKLTYCTISMNVLLAGFTQ